MEETSEVEKLNKIIEELEETIEQLEARCILLTACLIEVQRVCDGLERDFEALCHE